jgi:2,5-diketo-D-gluconate reductase B
MKYQTIKGEIVPTLGLGTWRLSGEKCARSVERALALGYRHIDTAQMYANEGEVGRGIRSSGVGREEIFLVTKVRTSSFSHNDVLRSTRESLRRLQTDYVDLLLMHWPNPSVPLEETLGAMNASISESVVPSALASRSASRVPHRTASLSRGLSPSPAAPACR